MSRMTRSNKTPKGDFKYHLLVHAHHQPACFPPTFTVMNVEPVNDYIHQCFISAINSPFAPCVVMHLPTFDFLGCDISHNDCTERKHTT